MITNTLFRGSLYLLGLSILLTGCTSSRYATQKLNTEFNYFQKGIDSAQPIQFTPLTIKPNDLLNIQVSSNTLLQEQAAVFNAANFGGTIGTNGASMNQQQTGGASINGFLVDEAGFMKYPLIGKLSVNGLTRMQLAKLLEDSLSKNEWVKDPVVQVRFLQLKVNVLGEVKAPGTKNFATDRITILDAISAAGDLTDRGRRDNIYVFREENGHKKAYQINLLDMDFLNSPANQLQQNDVVYVSSNKIKLKEVTYDPQFSRNLQIGTTILSVISVVTSLIFIFFKK